MNPESNRFPEGTKWSEKEWADWLTKRVERRITTFVNEPEEMFGSYQREAASVEDYRGRAILELLQNAERLRIRLTRWGQDERE